MEVFVGIETIVVPPPLILQGVLLLLKSNKIDPRFGPFAGKAA
jgi:hypothetical protein